MLGAIAEAFYGIPIHLKEEAFKRITHKIQDYYDMFREKLKNM